MHPVLDHHIHFQPSHLRADALFFGVFLAYLHNFQPEVVQKLMRDPWRFPVSVVSILALAPALFLPPNDPFIYTVGFTLVYIGFGTMLLLSIYQEGRKRPKPGLVVRWIAWMGTYSYTCTSGMCRWRRSLGALLSASARSTSICCMRCIL